MLRSVKDHLRMRLTESGWTNQLTQLINESVAKRIESGQTTKNIKFNELYTDIIEKAHGKCCHSHFLQTKLRR